MIAEKARKTPDFRRNQVFWWGMVDSNHRRHSQQIYSLSPLATREIPHINLCVSLAFGAGRRTRTPDLLITKRSWGIKNGPFGPFFHISAPNENWPELLVSTVSVCFFRVWVTVWVAVFVSVHRWWALFFICLYRSLQKLYCYIQRLRFAAGAPPLMRGKVDLLNDQVLFVGITPAYVGKSYPQAP